MKLFIKKNNNVGLQIPKYIIKLDHSYLLQTVLYRKTIYKF